MRRRNYSVGERVEPAPTIQATCTSWAVAHEAPGYYSLVLEDEDGNALVCATHNFKIWKEIFDTLAEIHGQLAPS